PYIEQQNLYTQINADIITPGAPPSVNALLITPVPIYLCPADKGDTTNPNFGNYGKMNYVVNRWVVGPDTNSNPAPMTIQQIPDGSSNVLLVGERDMTFNIAATAFIRHNNTSASFEGRVGRGLNPRPAPGSVFT